MKKVIRLTESELINLVKTILSEQPIPAPETQIVQGRGNDPYEYKKENGQYFTRRKGQNNWISTTGKVANAIARVAFGDKPLFPETKKVVNKVPKKVPKKTIKKVVNKNKPKVQTQSYTYSPRVDAELEYIKDRLPWWKKLLGSDAEKPFFIYDPKYNLLFLFNKDFSLIKSTSVVDGKDAQKDTEPFHTEDWCKASNLDTAPHICTNKGTKQKQFPSYKSLNDMAVKFIPRGIYTINALYREGGFSGKGLNTYSLADSSGKDMSAAIHGIPKMAGRLMASKNLEKLLQSEKNGGRVPQEYLKAVDTVIASANMSYGCIGIPAAFVEDPKVIAVVKVGVPVYVMGESNQGYLVQNSSKYFNELNGDGQSCANPMMIASEMGKQLPSQLSTQSGYENIA